MSQSTIVKAESSNPLLSLNMRNIDQLFPEFAPGDFALLQGNRAVQSLVALLCIRAQLPTQLGGLASNVIFIDGANTVRLYQTTRLAGFFSLTLNGCWIASTYPERSRLTRWSSLSCRTSRISNTDSN